MFTNQMPQISGYCRKCTTHHTLAAGKTEDAAQKLVTQLRQHDTINIFSPEPQKEPALSFTSLFGKSCGKMFGILEVVDISGKRDFLYAFSGQYNGRWLVPGWVPPPFSTEEFYKIYTPQEQQIKALSKEMETLEKKSRQWQLLRQKRKQLSRRLNADVQALCQLHNFCGEQATLPQIFAGQGIPTGTGECCTPKLLDYAARKGLTPIGICEFFIGGDTRSGSCRHGRFYPPCPSKCQPLIGFMLCGL